MGWNLPRSSARGRIALEDSVSRGLRRLQRGAQLLLAALIALVAIGVVAPAAQAADPLDRNYIYATGRDGNPDPWIWRYDPVAGSAERFLRIPGTPNGNPNALGISRDGEHLMFIDDTKIYSYVASTEQWTTVSRTSDGSTGWMYVAGAVDPTTGKLYYGGVPNTNNTANWKFNSFDPETGVITPGALEFTLPAGSGANADITFDSQGNLYLAASHFAPPNGDSTTSLFRVDGPVDDFVGAATPLGDPLPNTASLTSMAVGIDGNLYLANSAGDVIKIDVVSFTEVDRYHASGAPLGFNDFASNEYPSTILLNVNLPEGRAKAGDQFHITLTDELDRSREADTAGAEDGLQNQTRSEYVGRLLAGTEYEYRFQQTPAGSTDLDDYTTTWQCIVITDGDTRIANGSGNSGSVTMPAIAQDVDCTFTNTPRPQAEDDTSAGNKIGDSVTSPVLGNDDGKLDPSTVKITGADAESDGKTKTVAGEGVWTVNDDGTITFKPEAGFEGDPTPINYTVQDIYGAETGAKLTVTYVPAAVNDESLNNPQGETVTVNTLENDKGTLDPATVQITGADPDSDGRTKTVAGEGVWTVDPATGDITFTPEEGFTGNPTPIDYTVTDEEGRSTGAQVTVTYVPEATDDRSTGNAPGSSPKIPVLKNDSSNVDPDSLQIVGADEGSGGRTKTVEGEGIWTFDPETGEMQFEPEEGFIGDPTPIDYTVTDAAGNVTGAKVIVTYLPVATDDESLDNQQGSAVTVATVSNDSNNVDPSTVKLVGADSGSDGLTKTVAGEGKWTVNPETGDITFTPEDGFTGNPTDIAYTVADAEGNETGAKVHVTYLPDAVDDESLLNPQGSAVTVPTVANDSDNVDPTTVRLTGADAGSDGRTKTVPGEGVWTVDPDTGDITFTPEDGFTGNPTDIAYTVADAAGNETGANVHVTYVPTAADDESLNNPQGSTVTVPTVANDSDNLDPTTVRLTGADAGSDGRTKTVPGEGVWTVDPDTGDITFTPEDGFTGNPTDIAYTVADAAGNETGAKVHVTYVPKATDDESLNNRQGSTVTVDVVGNDSANIDRSTVRIVDPESGEPVSEAVVPGEGTWRVNPANGAISFEPEPGFTGNPTPIGYTAADEAGNPVTARVVVTYLPEATDDESLNNPQGSTVTVPTVANDSDNLDPTTVRLSGADAGSDGRTKTVPGEGVWTVDPETGDITFTPEDGFTGNPTDIVYTVADAVGNETGANVHVTYVPTATDDESLNNPQGSVVTVPTVANDSDNLDPSTVRLAGADAGSGGRTKTVPGEGVWTVDPETGDITFTPEDGFTGNPTDIAYTVADAVGNETGANVHVTYVPTATDDESLNNPQGSVVTVPTVANDSDNLDPSTVRLTEADEGSDGRTKTVPGEGVWTVDPETGDITFTPEDGFTGNPTDIAYTVADAAGNETGAKVHVTYLPEATDDESLNNPQGSTVTVDVVGNDSANIDRSTVRLVDPASGESVSELGVPGEGTWRVNPVNGAVSFEPEDGFTGNPTPIDYTAADAAGNPVSARVVVTYLPEAVDDESLNNPQGTAVTVPVVENDSDNVDPSSVRVVESDEGTDGRTKTVPGEGVWTVDGDTGDITFTPEDGFTGNPSDIEYTVSDPAGNETGAQVRVTYLPEAVDDESLNNPRGTAVTVPVLGNDAGDLDQTTVQIAGADSGTDGRTRTVPGEGVWTVDPETGNITFTPERGFSGNPAPIDYTVADAAGNRTGAQVRVTYIEGEPPVEPKAAHDESLNNPRGTAVTVPVLGNDEGDLDPSSVRIIDPVTGERVTELVVPGEGVWSVDPVTGDITFTPEPGFAGNPTPIEYVVSDLDGNELRARITVTYVDGPEEPNPKPPTDPGKPAPPTPPTPGTPPAPPAPQVPGTQPKRPAGTLPITGNGELLGGLAAGAALLIGGTVLLLRKRLRKG